MTKEEYIQWRNTGQLDSIAYEYWKEVKPIGYLDLEEAEFKVKLNEFLQKFNGHGVMTPNREIKLIDVGSIANMLIEYYNNKFEIS